MPRIKPINVGRVIGAVGSSVPFGDAAVLGFIKKKAGTPIGMGAKQGMKYIGGPAAVAAWSYTAYQNRDTIMGAPGKVHGVYSNLWGSFKDSDIHDRNRGDPSNTRTSTSRGGRGATTLSQSARRSVRPGIGKVRRRCKHRNKAGKQCLRPAGHSGRHRYR